MISYRQARKAIGSAAVADVARQCVLAELTRARAHYEAVADGAEQESMTAGCGAELLAAMDWPRQSEAGRLMRRRLARIVYDTIVVDDVRYAQKRQPRSWRPGRMSPARRVGRVCAQHGPCPCARCVEHARDPMREIPPRAMPVRLTAAEAEQQRIHDAETNRELALWYRLVWAPEAAAEARAHRPDDRPARAWAELREVLERLGVFRQLAPRRRSAVLAFWLGVCPVRGPSDQAACYRRASLRVAGSYRGAPVT